MNKKIASIYKKLKKLKDVRVCRNEPLSKHTTFKIGGPVDVLIIPKSLNGLKDCIRICGKLPLFIIGNGSNILVSDRGVRGVILKLSSLMNNIVIEGKKVRAGAGVLVSKLLNHTANMGLSGLEFSTGIPASIGGAVITNMGAFGQTISRLVNEIIVVNRKGEEITIKKRDLIFGYRKSDLLMKNCVIVQVVLVLRRSKRHKIIKKIKEYLSVKREKQPISVPSAGCIFKNPKGKYAGKLIEDANCKGIRVGGAEVSKTHANYIINLGDATCEDVKKLAKIVSKKVKQKCNVQLKYEIIDSSHLNSV